MAPFTDWLEQHLGTMAEGKETDLVAGTTPVYICRYPDQPAEGATTYATVGLGKTWLHANGRHVRQELLMSRWGDDRYDCARLLPWVAGLVIDSGDAILHGEVLGPAGPLLPEVTMEALVALHPAYHDRAFDSYRGDEGHPAVAMTWLIPATAEEAAYVDRHGLGRFMDLVEERDPDLLDWQRPSLLTDDEIADVSARRPPR